MPFLELVVGCAASRDLAVPGEHRWKVLEGDRQIPITVQPPSESGLDGRKRMAKKVLVTSGSLGPAYIVRNYGNSRAQWFL